MMYAGIEAGGTKWVCAVADETGEITATSTVPTTTPDETLSRTADFITEHASGGALRGLGIGCFGPLDLHPSSPTYGHITTTPKPGWAHTDVVSGLRDRLGATADLPVAFDTDVNAAAYGEWRRGAATGLDTFCYLTVGTGIGGGAMVGGRLLHGRQHPEFGHLRVPHDRDRDPFAGCCPYHGDCWEGLASGEAMRRRWGRPAETLVEDPAETLVEDAVAGSGSDRGSDLGSGPGRGAGPDAGPGASFGVGAGLGGGPGVRFGSGPVSGAGGGSAAGAGVDVAAAWRLEADYLAYGLVSVIHVLSPERIIVGGGVAGHPGLLDLVRERVAALVAGYLDLPPLDGYLVAPGLGGRAGVVGAIELARTAAGGDAD